MEDKQLNTLLEQLEHYSKSVGRVTAEMIPQVRETIEGNPTLPEGCPSKASMAELILRQIHGPLSEVTGILDMIREHLFEHYDDRK